MRQTVPSFSLPAASDGLSREAKAQHSHNQNKFKVECVNFFFAKADSAFHNHKVGKQSISLN